MKGVNLVDGNFYGFLFKLSDADKATITTTALTALNNNCYCGTHVL